MDVNRKTELYRNISQKSSSQKEYNSVYRKATDTLMSFKENNLKLYGFLGIGEWKLDSLLCFNDNADRCMMSVSFTTSPDSDHDGLEFFYGAKIKGEWYFFLGANVHLPRSLYQEDIHTPLSFEKMHEIAMEEVFRGYLIKDEKGEWQINERFFERMADKNRSRGYGSCLECTTEEEYYLYLSKKNWIQKHTVLKEDEVEMSYNEPLKLLKLSFPLRPYAKYIVPWKVVIKAHRDSDPSNVLIEYIQSKTNFEETGFMGEMSFKDIHPSDTLTFSIQFYFSGSGNEDTKPLVLTRSVNKLRSEIKPRA